MNKNIHLFPGNCSGQERDAGRLQKTVTAVVCLQRLKASIETALGIEENGKCLVQVQEISSTWRRICCNAGMACMQVISLSYFFVFNKISLFE